VSKPKKPLPQQTPHWEPSPEYIRAECAKIRAEKCESAEQPLDGNVCQGVLDALLAGIEDEDFEEPVE